MSDQLNDYPAGLLNRLKLIQKINAQIEENTILMRVQQGIIDSVNHKIIHHKNFYDPEGSLETIRDEPRVKILALEAENKALNWVKGIMNGPVNAEKKEGDTNA